MYLNGFSLKGNYISDPNKTGIVKDYSVGLTLISISRIRGGTILKDNTHNVNYLPLGVRIDDNNKRFYDLSEGSYQVVFEQGMTKVPNNSICTIEGNNFLRLVGCTLFSEKFFDFKGRGNLSAVLIIPTGCNISLELGSSIADLYLEYEEFQKV